MKKWLSIIMIIFFTVLMVNCSTAGSEDGENKQQAETTKNANDNENSQNDLEKSDDNDSVPVQIIHPRYGDISSFLLFSSNIDSEKMVDIYPMTTGIIEAINHDEGDPVKKGDILAVLDDREASINEQKARINFQQFKMEFTRQEEIFNKHLISKEDYERMKYNLEKARLDWEQRRLLLSYTRIKTPISGVVNKRYIKVGNKINMTQLAFSVIQDREKIAVVNIPEQEKPHIFTGQRALITAGSQPVPGSVKRISPAIDPESGTFKVTLQVKDDTNLLAVGQFVNVKIVKKVHQNALLLAKEALIYEGGKVYVFILDDKVRARKKEITVGFDDGSRVEVVKGLSGDNERVVTAGKSSLKENAQVKIVEPVTS